MHISPSVILLALILFLFAPSLQEWVIQGGAIWYRPYLLWLGATIIVWWWVRRYQKKMDTENNQDEDADAL